MVGSQCGKGNRNRNQDSVFFFFGSGKYNNQRASGVLTAVRLRTEEQETQSAKESVRVCVRETEIIWFYSGSLLLVIPWPSFPFADDVSFFVVALALLGLILANSMIRIVDIGVDDRVYE